MAYSDMILKFSKLTFVGHFLSLLHSFEFRSTSLVPYFLSTQSWNSFTSLLSIFSHSCSTFDFYNYFQQAKSPCWEPEINKIKTRVKTL